MNKLYSGVAIGALGFALLGGINVNVGTNVNYHQLLKPDLITTQSQYIIGHVYNVNLGDELGGAEEIQPVITMLESAHFYDTVIFRIKGYGGSVDGLFAILNAIKLSHAHIIMSVEGNSSSAYAVLATSGPELKVSPNAYLMYHMGSINGVDCSAETGTFDGIPASESCQNIVDAYTKELRHLIMINPLLTNLEKLTILSGHEIYIHSDEMNRRIDHENLQTD